MKLTKISLMKTKNRWCPTIFLGSEKMNTHIVRVNEKIEKIANIYNLEIEEITKINHHIKDWQNLIPGTKLRIPEIPEIVKTELDNTEPFIEEYYPKISIDEYLQKQTIIKETTNENESQTIKEPEPKIKPKKYPNPNGNYHSYYNNYYPNGYFVPPFYPLNYQLRRAKKTTKKPTNLN